MRRRDVHCKVCGCPLEKYSESGLYHCTNMKDMSHRGLILSGVVEAAPRYAVGNLTFLTKKQVRQALGRRGLRECKRIEKVTA